MSVSSINVKIPAAPQAPAASQVSGTDSDGDHDGSRPGEVEGAAASVPVKSNPTPTLGNNVDTHA